jgi:hypothetical protein
MVINDIDKTLEIKQTSPLSPHLTKERGRRGEIN